MPTKRRLSRELALAFLYQKDMVRSDTAEDKQARLRWPFRGPDDGEDYGIDDLGKAYDTREVREFAAALADGTLAHLVEIDALIAERAEHWKIERMPIVDRNILRLGVYELLFRDDIPPKVSINEAVDLAKRYCDEPSGAFINGVLDNLSAIRRKGK